MRFCLHFFLEAKNTINWQKTFSTGTSNEVLTALNEFTEVVTINFIPREVEVLSVNECFEAVTKHLRSLSVILKKNDQLMCH